MPMGRLTRKIARQLTPVVSTPPRIGPSAVEMPVTAPHAPKATPRSRPWKVDARSASDVENSIAPPTPCSARDTISMTGSCATPQSSEPSVKITKPIEKIRRLPNLSAIDPDVSSNDASASAYASVTHCN